MTKIGLLTIILPLLGTLISKPGVNAENEAKSLCSAEKKDECAKNGEACRLAVSGEGYECYCEFPLTLKDGQCIYDPRAGQLTLRFKLDDFDWADGYDVKDSQDFLKIRDSLEVLLKNLVPSSTPVVDNIFQEDLPALNEVQREFLKPDVFADVRLSSIGLDSVKVETALKQRCLNGCKSEFVSIGNEIEVQERVLATSFTTCSAKQMSECQNLNAQCVEHYGVKGYKCQCELPMVLTFSGDCKALSETDDYVSVAQLPLIPDQPWSDDLTDKRSYRYLKLKRDVEILLEKVIPDATVTVNQFVPPNRFERQYDGSQVTLSIVLSSTVTDYDTSELQRRLQAYQDTEQITIQGVGFSILVNEVTAEALFKFEATTSEVSTTPEAFTSTAASTTPEASTTISGSTSVATSTPPPTTSVASTSTTASTPPEASTTTEAVPTTESPTTIEVSTTTVGSTTPGVSTISQSTTPEASTSTVASTPPESSTTTESPTTMEISTLIADSTTQEVSTTPALTTPETSTSTVASTMPEASTTTESSTTREVSTTVAESTTLGVSTTVTLTTSDASTSTVASTTPKSSTTPEVSTTPALTTNEASTSTVASTMPEASTTTKSSTTTEVPTTVAESTTLAVSTTPSLTTPEASTSTVASTPKYSTTPEVSTTPALTTPKASTSTVASTEAEASTTTKSSTTTEVPTTVAESTTLADSTTPALMTSETSTETAVSSTSESSTTSISTSTESLVTTPASTTSAAPTTNSLTTIPATSTTNEAVTPTGPTTPTVTTEATTTETLTTTETSETTVPSTTPNALTTTEAPVIPTTAPPSEATTLAPATSATTTAKTSTAAPETTTPRLTTPTQTPVTTTTAATTPAPLKCEEDRCQRGGDFSAICLDDTCKCSDGFVPEDGVCKDRDECALDKVCSRSGDINAKCTNYKGSYVCDCTAGYIFGYDTCIETSAKTIDKCQDKAVNAECSAINAVCVRSLNEKGYTCECRFPTVELNSPITGKRTCFVSTTLSPYKASFILKNTWLDDFSDKSTTNFILYDSKIRKLIRRLFSVINPIYDNIERTSTGFIKVNFFLNPDVRVNIVNYVASIQKKFVDPSNVVDVAVPDLISDLTTLQASKKGLTCNRINTCAAGEDKYALCSNSDDGPVCTCSEGFGVLNNICQDIDECASKPCNAGGDTAATCKDFYGYFKCTCSAGYVPSLYGCSPYNAGVNLCQSAEAKADCEAKLGVCARTLNSKGYACECIFPKVLDTDGKCRVAQSALDKVYSAILPLGSSTKWTDEFNDSNSLPFLQLKAEAERFLKAVFKDATAVVNGFRKTGASTLISRRKRSPQAAVETNLMNSPSPNITEYINEWLLEAFQKMTFEPIEPIVPKYYEAKLPLGPELKWSDALDDPESAEYMQLKAETEKFLRVVFKGSLPVVTGFKKNLVNRSNDDPRQGRQNPNSEVSVISTLSSTTTQLTTEVIRQRLIEAFNGANEVTIPGISFTVLSNLVSSTLLLAASSCSCDTTTQECVSNACVCKSGYSQTGTSGSNPVCSDIDECSSGSPCGIRGTCTNTAGSYSCTCETGLQLTNGQCTDVDECASSKPCSTSGDSGARCLNSYGSYACYCSKGYSFESGTCKKTSVATTFRNVFYQVLQFIVLSPFILFSVIVNLFIALFSFGSFGKRSFTSRLRTEPQKLQDMAEFMRKLTNKRRLMRAFSRLSGSARN